jgi:RNA polymerase sigma-70 factor (ECF subfamily)
MGEEGRFGMETTSPTLLQRVRDARDDQAWQAFFDLYYPIICKYARIQGLSQGDAEEIAQECMQSLSRYLRSFEYSRSRGRFRGLLRKMVHNQIASQRRRKKPRLARSGELEAQAASDDEDKSWEQLWIHEHLVYCLQQLETRYSKQTVDAFRLYALEDRPVDEVCRKLGVTPNQVYLAKTRMIRRLRADVRELIGDVL